MGIEKLPDVCTVKQIAEFLQLHIDTVKRALRVGELKGFKIGKEWRIYREDIEKWIKAQK